MDLQVGYRFTKGRRVSEIQETTSIERGGMGLCQTSSVLLFFGVWAHSFFNLEMCHIFNHALLKDIYWKCNESFMHSLTNLKWSEENLKCQSHQKAGLQWTMKYYFWWTTNCLLWNNMQKLRYFRGDSVTFLHWKPGYCAADLSELTQLRLSTAIRIGPLLPSNNSAHQ